MKRMFAVLLVLCVLSAVLPVADAAIGDYTGKQDWLWPVPSSNTISSCYMDLIGHGYGHYALDIIGDHYADIIAPYDGKVIVVNNACNQDYPKSGSGYCPCYACSNLGKYVYIVHEYLGTTFVSRYGHMASIKVSEGDTVTKGQVIGTVGSTGRSFGYHLDFRIYQGTEKTSEVSTCVDPLMDQFLKLPKGFNSNAASSWSTCCYEYADDVRALYELTACKHPEVDAFGTCMNPDCGEAFDWAATFDGSCAGVYTVNIPAGIAPRTDLPYTASQNLAAELSYGQEVEVAGSVTNGFGEVWYQVTASEETGFVPAESLVFLGHGAQHIVCNDFKPTHAEVIAQAPYNLSGTVVSRYPLTKVVAYLDGSAYSTWTASDTNTTTLALKGTNINYALTFGGLSIGKHTIELKGMDIYRTEPETFFISSFFTGSSTEETSYTVLFNANGGSCDTDRATVVANATLDTLPDPVRSSYGFLGWYTDPTGGQLFTEGMPVTENMTLYARWSRTLHPAEGGNLYFVKETGMIIGADATVTTVQIPQVIGAAAVTGIADNAFAGCEQLTYVVYCGTQEQWDALEMGDGNEPMTQAARTYHAFEENVCTYCGQKDETGWLRLTEDTVLADYELSQDLYVDLGGFDLTGTIKTNGFAVYGKDSATDGYTGENAGSFSCTDETGAAIAPQQEFRDETAKRYLCVQEQAGYSFHRFYLGLTHVSLAPKVTGFGYKALFCGDAAVKAQLAENSAFAIHLQLEGLHTVTRHKNREALVSGEPITLRLQNYDVENFGETPLYAQVTLTLADGTVIESARTSTTMRTMLEKVSASADKYTQEQLAAISAMIENWQIVKSWNTENLYQ